MDEFPEELKAPPLPVAALLGSEALHARCIEALHESAVASCGSRRVRYLSSSGGEVSTSRPCNRGRKDAPGYVVHGILKRRWLKKVCSELPAVLVLVFDWSATPQPSGADEQAALARLQEVRRGWRDRETRLLLLLVLHPDAVDTEAIGAPLRQQPESSGLIVVRGAADLVAAKAQKLERLVYQHAIAFYADEEKRHRKVRSPRNAMPQWARNALQVRACFKVGFLAEFRRDVRAALKNYIRAYEQLIQDADIAGVVERMAVCNHITIRMYQLYLQSHDISAAVHHCRIHTATLRSCCSAAVAATADPGDAARVERRKWHWLSTNHKLFAELLESVSEQLPLIIDQADMWQFPGFHYQSAATYGALLRRRARAASSGPQVATGSGGALVLSEYVGQAATLERPTECADAAAEVEARLLQVEAACDSAPVGGEVPGSPSATAAAPSSASAGSRGSLARAEAACQARGLINGATVSALRRAEEHFGEGRYGEALALFDDLLRELPDVPASVASAAAPRAPLWPALRRRAVERAAACLSRELGLDPPGGQPSATLPDGWHRLLTRVLELYAGDGTCAKLADGDLQRLLSECLRHLPGGGSVQPVPLHALKAQAEVTMDPLGGGPVLTLSLVNALRFDLEVRSTARCHCVRDAVLELAVPGSSEASVSWPSGGSLKFTGRAPPGLTPLAPRRLELEWFLAGAREAIPVVVRRFRDSRTSAAEALPERQSLPSNVPSAGKAAAGAAGAAGAAAPALGLRAELRTPCDPRTALVGEHFLVHILLRTTPAAIAPTIAASEDGQVVGAPAGSVRLEGEARPLSSGPSAAKASSAAEETANGAACAAAAELSLLPAVAGADVASGPLLTLGEGQEIASLVSSKGASGSTSFQLRGAAQVLALEAAAAAASGADEGLLVVPLVVRRSWAGGAVVALRLRLLRDGEADVEVQLPPLTLQFQPALEVSFDDRAQSSAAAAAAQALPRRFAVRSLARCRLSVHAVGVQRADSEVLPALGAAGVIEPRATHAFALPPRIHGKARLLLHFGRAEAAEAFAASLPGADALAQALLRCGGALAGRAEFSVPQEAPAGCGAGAAQQQQLRVLLEHAASAKVVEPIDVVVRVARPLAPSSTTPMELRVHVQMGESGEGSDKFFLRGPSSTQVLLSSASAKQPEADTSHEAAASAVAGSEVCTSFALVPLRPGWISLPRVQVSSSCSGEAASPPANIFVFPADDCVQWRATA